ncbi:hypothetical protein AKO1_008020 [Acrasis kona]|uniref:Uncharacterized protein n=1 Tax=Acrasis kona TaxID=1008807 RepID=A0AAW2YSK6_9EUKA
MSEAVPDEYSNESPQDEKRKISPRKKLVLKAKEEQEQQEQQQVEEGTDGLGTVNESYETSNGIYNNYAAPNELYNNWRVEHVNEVLFPNGSPSDVYSYVRYQTRTNSDPLQCNDVCYSQNVANSNGCVNNVYSSLKYEIHQEVTMRYYNLCDQTKRMSYPPCLSMRILVMSADSDQELKKCDTSLKGKIDCTLIPSEEYKNAAASDVVPEFVTYMSTQKIQFAKGARDQKAYFQISYFDARDITSSTPIMIVRSPQFSVWSRHTRNSSKKSNKTSLKRESSSTPEELREDEISMPPTKVHRTSNTLAQQQSTSDSQAQVEAASVQLSQYTGQLHSLLTYLSDKQKMDNEERRQAFTLAFQHLCSAKNQ